MLTRDGILYGFSRILEDHMSVQFIEEVAVTHVEQVYLSVVHRVRNKGPANYLQRH